jgi:acetyl-CoA synthetase
MASAEGSGFYWRPDPDLVAKANLTAFLESEELESYEALLERSSADPSWYWESVIRHFGVRFHTAYDTLMDDSAGAPWTRWCVGGTTNLVLNCLDGHGDDDRQAVVWEGEDGRVRSWTLGQLKAETARLASGLRGLGLGRGDVIALYMPMLPETVAAFLAVAKIGAIAVPLFSGFGSEAVAARLQDAGASAVLTVDGTRRRGHTVPMKAILDAAAERVDTVRHVVTLADQGTGAFSRPGRDHDWHALTRDRPDHAPTEPLPADDPFMIVFTSGTAGRAKGTVHTHCGFVTKLAADFGLCLDFKRGDRMLWMSDLGWVVGPMQIVVSLFFGGTLVLAEGTPDYPDRGRLWRLVQDHRVSYLGLAPTIGRAMMRHGADEVARHDLASLRVTVSSGELWNPDSWTWFVDNVCRNRVPLLNVSGGTEIGWGIVTCTVLEPLKPCAFAGPCPGMGADIVDPEGRPVGPGEMGELVLRVPSIGLTRGLWRNPERYLESYWNSIPGLWVHGDWASRDGDGQWFLHGRSDDTIMVAGKRCGPFEVESILMDTGLVAEAAASGADDALKGEVVVCACVAGPGVSGDAETAARLSDAVARRLSPAFRPQRIVFVPELPKTRNMKVMRRVVRAVFEGRSAGDLAALVNPEAVKELRAKVAAGGGPASGPKTEL